MTEFKDYPDFKPNLSPKQIFELGSFGGTYWRPITSSITNKKYKNQHLEFPNKWWNNIPSSNLISCKYNKNINNYNVKVGTSLTFWEDKEWIISQDPYGWIQWYCRFYLGRRTKDDIRQIKRWKAIASENGRFRKWLITLILKKNGKWNDKLISPKIRQTLQHWGYKLTEKDFMKEVENRNQ